ncbi:Arc family DNA-binding protein [Vibrio cholerae]
MIMKKEQAKPFSLRLSEELRSELESLAKQGHRSLNAEIEMRLLGSIEADKAKRTFDEENPLKNIQHLATYIKETAEALEIQSVLAQADYGLSEDKE